MQTIRATLPLLFAILAMPSCSNDSYESGDSTYSYLRTDFADATTDAQARIVSATTDDNAHLSFPTPFSTSWTNVADTTYRTLLYYTTTDNSSQHSTANPVSAARVYVLTPKSANETEPTPTDPIHFQSAWLSSNKKYINLSVVLMTGIADSIETKQSIGLTCDSTTTDGRGHHTYHYKLTHAQGDVPQYYKSTIYVSIPTNKMTVGDCVRLSLNTYNGLMTRDFTI